MTISRHLPNLLRCTALALVATTAFAGGWVTKGGPGPRGGFHGGGARAVGHGWVGGAVHFGGGVHYGGTLRALPRGYASYNWAGAPYYRYGGYWYRPWRGAYIGCYPPLGLWLDVLPFGYASYVYGGIHYYGYDDVYYTDGPSGGYVVTDPPPERQAASPAQPPAGSPDAAALDALLIVPKEGQSTERMKTDRAAAQRFALQKSGYDPADSDPSDPGTPRARRAYLRAMRNYLESRGYSVE